MNTNKQELRATAKQIREKLNIKKISGLLRNKLVKTDEYKKAKNIMIFYPLSHEVNLLPLLEDRTKNFYLPRVAGSTLECCAYKTGDKLNLSRFHTYEPTCTSCSPYEIDLAIIPALACDKNFYRLGYGGGYYDRFLTINLNLIKICCIPSNLLLTTVYPEKHDIKMDKIITELSAG